MRDLPMPGSPDSNTTLAFAALRLLPAAQQQLDFLVAADQRRRNDVQRLEPALRRADAQHLPGLDVRGEALEGDRAEIAILEQAADQLFRAGRDHYRARLRQRLQPSREVRCLADDRLFLGGAGANEIANDHGAGRDPDANLQRNASDSFELRRCLDEGEPGMDGCSASCSCAWG